MPKSKRRRKKAPKRVLPLPDLEQAKAVLNSLTFLLPVHAWPNPGPYRPNCDRTNWQPIHPMPLLSPSAAAIRNPMTMTRDRSIPGDGSPSWRRIVVNRLPIQTPPIDG